MFVNNSGEIYYKIMTSFFVALQRFLAILHDAGRPFWRRTPYLVAALPRPQDIVLNFYCISGSVPLTRRRFFLLAFLPSIIYNTPAAPGLAKFGIAPGLGPGDRGFKSRNPDQKWGDALRRRPIFASSYLVVGFEQGGGAAAKNSPVDCFSARGKVPQPGPRKTLEIPRNFWVFHFYRHMKSREGKQKR